MSDEDQIPQEQVTAAFDGADQLLGRLEAIDRALDAHRREILLMWVAVTLLAGVVALQAWERLRADA